MAADNVVANPGTGGATFRAFSDGTNEWPASVVCYTTGGSAGAWTLQQVNASNGLPVSVLGTVPVSGTFWQATQPVSIAATVNTSSSQSGTWNVTVNTALPAGSSTIGGVELVDSAGTNKASISAAGALKVDGSAVTQPVSGTFWQATQPVSGTITANAGTGTFTVSDTTLALSQASTTSGQKGTLMLGAVTTAAPSYTTAQTNPFSLTTAGALRVDGSAVTQPVSGTFWQATQPVSGTFWQTTQPVSIAATVNTSDLADGPVTPGTAATKSVLIGAQYNTSAPTPTTGQQVALQTDSSGNLKVNVAAGGGSGGTSSTFSAAFPSTGTAAGASDGTNMKPLLVDASGFLKVNVAAGGGSGGTSSSYGSAFPATGTASGFSDGTNMQAARVFDADTGAGTQYVLGVNLRSSASGGSTELLGQQAMAASVPVAIASNQSAVPVSGTFWQATQPVSGTFWQATQPVSIAATVNVADANLELAQGSTTSGQVGPLLQGAVTTAAPTYTTAKTNPLSLTTAGALRVDGSAVTQPVSGTVTANAGTGSFTVAQATAANLNATVTGTVTANVGTTNGLALDATLTGGSQKAIPVAGTSGGATAYHLVSAASTNATSVKASAGTVYSVQGFNTNASARYLKFYNKASVPTVGTDTPVKVIMMPGNASGAGATATFPVGVNFSTGIAIAITGGIADSDSTAVGASDCVINFDYA